MNTILTIEEMNAIAEIVGYSCIGVFVAAILFNFMKWVFDWD